jgi:hypothetical protein
LEINQLTTVTKEVVEAARENLIIGVMWGPASNPRPTTPGNLEVPPRRGLKVAVKRSCLAK